VAFLRVGGLTLTNQNHMKKELRADLSERLPSALFSFLLSKTVDIQICGTVKFSSLCGRETSYLCASH
jgi:hypothetical protein